jgi:subtilisin family serine protease
MRLLAAVAVVLVLGAAPALASRGPALVQLKGPSGAFALQAAGGTLVSTELRLWKLPGAAATRLVPRLAAAGAVSAVEPDRVMLHPLAFSDIPDPLVPQEWWIPVIGADTVVPPGPGVPVTVIDSGVDLTHPEFAGRPDTSALNQQTLVGRDVEHGTAVSSVVGAPVNGVGVVGVYPQAVLRVFDTSPADTIDEASVIQGIVEASRAGRGVINLSLGGPDRSDFMAQAIVLAFGRGTITVAAAGNEFLNGNALWYPASDPHVLTVAATTQENKPAVFSGVSSAVDLAAPGTEMPVAVPLTVDPSGYTTLNGTSFSAPLVAGATAWVWTARPTLETTQVYDLMRWSAKDIWEPGRDKDTGYGMLDIPAALTRSPPPIDPLEPNDDVDQVKAGGIFSAAKPLVYGSFRARVDLTEDPADLYRINVPAHDTLTVTLKPDANVNLELWGPLTRSVTETGAERRRDLLGLSANPGVRAEVVRWTNTARKAIVAYADVYFPSPSRALDANYALSIKTARAHS